MNTMKVGERQNPVEKRVSDACRLESAIVFGFSVATNKEAVISRFERARSAAQRFIDKMKEVYKDKPIELGSVRRGELELNEGLNSVILDIRRQSDMVSEAASELSPEERHDRMLALGVKVKEEAVKGAGKRVRMEITAKILFTLDLDSRDSYPESSGFVDELVLCILRSEPDMYLRRDIWNAAGLRETATLTRAAAGLPAEALVGRWISPAAQQSI